MLGRVIPQSLLKGHNLSIRTFGNQTTTVHFLVTPLSLVQGMILVVVLTTTFSPGLNPLTRHYGIQTSTRLFPVKHSNHLEARILMARILIHGEGTTVRSTSPNHHSVQTEDRSPPGTKIITLQ